MISQMGRLAFELYKDIKVNVKEEVEGEVKDVEREIKVRFDFIAPAGVTYELLHDALREISEELKRSEEESKRQEALRKDEDAIKDVK